MPIDLLRRAAIAIGALGLSLLAPSAQALLPIQHWKAASGAHVYFVQNRDLPMLDVSVDFPAGSGFDSEAKSGTAGLTQGLMRLGAGGLTEDEIARRIADVGAQMSGRFDTDRAGAGLRTLSSARERTQALDLLARILQQPEFPQAALDRERARLVAGLKEADTKPEHIASRVFNRMVYGGHPYGLRGSGEIDSVVRVTREDLLTFYRAHYVADHAIVAIMGDVSREEAAAIAEQLTGALPRAGGRAIVLPPVAGLERGAARSIAHPATQAHILIGGPGIRRDDPAFFPLFVGNYVLGGGGFASRLNEEVRQRRGLAYSVYSYFSPLSQQGVFQIGLQTRKESADEALAVVRATLAEFIANGPTEKELQAAKANIVGGFPLRIDSNRKIHEYLSLIGFYRLPLSYLDDFVKNVERVSAAEIKSSFARRVDPKLLVTVVVGAVAGTD